MSIESRDVVGKNMKILYLIFAKLKALIAEDKFFFSTLFVGVLTCNIMFTYMYGIIAQLNEKDGLADIFVYYTSGEKLSADQMDTLLDGYTVELDYYALIDAEKSQVGDNSVVQEYSIRAKETLNQIYTSTGVVDSLTEKNTVIIPNEIENVNIGDTIILNEKELKVVGSSLIPAFVMTKETFEGVGFVPDVVSIDAPNKSVRSILSFLYAQLENYTIEDVSTTGLDETTLRTLVTVIVIYLLCVLAFLYLMISIYDRNAYELNVYEIIGATRGETKAIIGGVVFVFLAFSSLLSQIIHIAFYKPFFSKLNLFGDYYYGMSDYLILFLITLFSVYIVVYIYINVRVNRSAIANSNNFIS